ncbi:hypothetical protein FISHEDRAFT_57490 [Fistulina hepatica ATCC 64428]|uniref:Uncharacterized protein n=1 Tax=Fistulina hepatica ATCC 64428 TaxID=1128425 RepID=A0A0D7AG48_9AGAR|nr:hypothetical protein FISHEDRAFT_57490 [Fistulina hepatica ATCC 64428]
MSSVAPATPTAVTAITSSLVGRKVRLVGRLLAYDPATGILVLVDQEAAILVDVSLCVGLAARDWLSDHLTLIMVIGYLERRLELAVPAIPVNIRPPCIDGQLVVNAILVTEEKDFDMQLWRLAIDALVLLVWQMHLLKGWTPRARLDGNNEKRPLSLRLRRETARGSLCADSCIDNEKQSMKGMKGGASCDVDHVLKSLAATWIRTSLTPIPSAHPPSPLPAPLFSTRRQLARVVGDSQHHQAVSQSSRSTPHISYFVFIAIPQRFSFIAERHTRDMPCSTPDPTYHPPVPIYQGVWLAHDGRELLSTDYPEVIQFCDAARRNVDAHRLELPTATCEAVWVLAALSVFLSPQDPVHWLFWREDVMNETAERIDRIYYHTPRLVTAVSWLGSTVQLSMTLSMIRGSDYRKHYSKTLPWFDALVPSKPPQLRVPNLRSKRKLVAADATARAESTNYAEEESEAEVPLPRKRARTRASRTTKAAPKLVKTIPVQKEAPLSEAQEIKDPESRVFKTPELTSSDTSATSSSSSILATPTIAPSEQVGIAPEDRSTSPSSSATVVDPVEPTKVKDRDQPSIMVTRSRTSASSVASATPTPPPEESSLKGTPAKRRRAARVHRTNTTTRSGRQVHSRSK